MCMGMMNYREPKEKRTVISCGKCGRSWKVTESVAKRFTEQDKGICPNCRSNKEKKAVSLLKQDATDEIKEKICDNICRFAVDCNITQDQLDEYCEKCIVDKIRRVEMI